MLSAAAVLIGVAIFVSALPADWDEGAHEEVRGLLGVLRVPGITTLVLTMFPVGFAFGASRSRYPPSASTSHARKWQACCSRSGRSRAPSAAFVYGVRPRRSPLSVVHQRLTLLLPLAFAFPLLAPSIPVMALMLIPAGVLIAPIIATRNELASATAPPGTKTEALTWPLTALVAGLSSGAAMGGRADRQLGMARGGRGCGRGCRGWRADRNGAARNAAGRSSGRRERRVSR